MVAVCPLQSLPVPIDVSAVRILLIHYAMLLVVKCTSKSQHEDGREDEGPISARLSGRSRTVRCNQNESLNLVIPYTRTVSLQLYSAFVMMQLKSREPDHDMNSASNSSRLISPFLTFFAIRSSRAIPTQSSSLFSSLSSASRSSSEGPQKRMTTVGIVGI